MLGSYADSAEFDLAVVFVVALVMPLGVYLLKAKSKVGQLTAVILLMLSFLYIGGFEHYRLHNARVTRIGIQKAVFRPMMQMWERDFRVTYLDGDMFSADGPQILRMQTSQMTVTRAEYGVIGAAPSARSNMTSSSSQHAAYELQGEEDGLTLPPRCSTAQERQEWANAMAKYASGAGRRGRKIMGAGSSDVEQYSPCDNSAMVHLAFPFTGADFFKNVFERVSSESCRDGPVAECVRCWNSKSGTSFSQVDEDTLFFQLGQPTSPADLSFIGRPYKAVFVVRDPREVVVDIYLSTLKAADMIDADEAVLEIAQASGGGEETWSAESSAEENEQENSETTEEEMVDPEMSPAVSRRALMSLKTPGVITKSALTNQRLVAPEAKADAINVIIDDLFDSHHLGRYADSLRRFAMQQSPHVAFVRFEDMFENSRSNATFASLSQFFRLDEKMSEVFLNACQELIPLASDRGLGAVSQDTAEDQEQSQEEGGEAQEPERVEPLWRTHFTPANVKHFNNIHGKLLRRMGYASK